MKKESEILYNQTAKVAEIFWEWRNKVLARFVTVCGGFLLLSGWFMKSQELKSWSFSPFVAATVFSIISFFQDRANTHVLRDCYRIGKELEEEESPTTGIFTSIYNIHYHKVSYATILAILYFSSSILYFFLSIYFYIKY